MDISLIIAVSALAFSLVSPIISEAIRGYYRLRERRLDMEIERQKRDQEFYQVHRAEVIERYICKAGQAIKNANAANVSEFGATSGEVFLYIDKSQWSTLEKINNAINYSSGVNAEKPLMELCQYLSTQEVRSKDQPQLSQRRERKAKRAKQ